MAASTGQNDSSGASKKLSTKIINMNHKLTPGNPNSWAMFEGEFKSLIDSNALTALKRGRPFNIT